MPASDPTADLGHSPDAQAQQPGGENLKIHCGRKYFALREDVSFAVVTQLRKVGL